MIIFILLLHNLAAIFLLGAITHQATASWRSGPARRPQGLAASFPAVRAELYATAIVCAYVLTLLLGDVLYGPYRVDVKTMLFETQQWAWNGVFEIKEHVAAIGLFLLPAYWLLWRATPSAQNMRARRCVSTLLAAIVWYALLAGHMLNNLKGVGF